MTTHPDIAATAAATKHGERIAAARRAVRLFDLSSGVYGASGCHSTPVGMGTAFVEQHTAEEWSDGSVGRRPPAGRPAHRPARRGTTHR